MLGEHQGDLAQQFAVASHDKFRGVSVHDGALALPMLTDALAHIECEVVERVVGGTHTIFLGRVLAASAGDGQPLTYFRGGFGRFEFGRDDQAYRLVRQQVLSRVYPADHVIGVEELALELDLEESAAFYALTRLTGDGLVRRDPDRGYVITAFDVRTSDDTFDARLAIELGVIDLVLDSRDRGRARSSCAPGSRPWRGCWWATGSSTSTPTSTPTTTSTSTSSPWPTTPCSPRPSGR